MQVINQSAIINTYFRGDKRMTYNTDDEKNTKNTNKIENKIETVVGTIDKKVDKFSTKLDEKFTSLDKKMASFDEEEFGKNLSKFFVKTGERIANFFTTDIPKMKNKITKILEGNSWGTIAPLVMLIIALVIIAIIATVLKS